MQPQGFYAFFILSAIGNELNFIFSFIFRDSRNISRYFSNLIIHINREIDSVTVKNAVKTGRLLLLAIFLNFCSVLPVNYRTDIFNLPRLYVERYINETLSHRYDVKMSNSLVATLFALMNSFTLIFEVPGALAAIYLLEKLGRKKTLMIMQPILSLFAAILMNIGMFFGYIETLYAGRALLGIAGGFAMAGVPVYLMECTPSEFRGLIGSFQV